MGVPKFFRFMSERYPTWCQLVHEFQIPEFDNLYLDMNGIIHSCSHPNDFDPHFRITDKAIFEAIFHYLEFIFKSIKPQKLFFLAVDGVAPRAKMNQQRGRRFRSAKDAEMLEERARKNGEKLPSEKRFDSNCITPGTVFMDELHKQLEYFITMKISNDPTWKKCQIILSGHNTPGEGEHKVMDYIRYLRSQPDYDSNTRHCLYGLDADLIMLGLCTHDPNFCLLREEVQFSKKKSAKVMTPEETNFFLLHLSLLREYLDLEFQDLKQTLPFPYDLENIIDDWVLMGFLVGNDFIPHLPDLHINTGAFPALFDAYKQVLPSLDGYLNERGQLNLKRFQAYLTHISKADFERFEEKYADLAYFEAKLTQKPVDIRAEEGNDVKALALQKLIAATEEMFPNEESESDSEEQDRQTMLREFSQHKSDYYRNKLEYDDVTEDVLKSQAEGYIRALQWILHYYYHGCRSWSWFYPHHYSPFVSDVATFSNPNLEFDMGKPFLPFHQLLAVLPPASKELLPSTYQPLMTDEKSPIRDFYPTDFDTDLNGKIQEWEAVVLIPFIDEGRLLQAMDGCQSGLTADENRRNEHGPMRMFSYTKKNLGEFVSDMFPNVPENHASVREIWPKDIAVDMSNLYYRPGHQYDPSLYISGFSTFRFLPHIGKVKKVGVRVFDRASTAESMVVTVTKPAETDIMAVAEKLLNKIIYVGWPHMIQAQVCSVSDKNVLVYKDGSGKIVTAPQQASKNESWCNVASSIQSDLYSKRAIVIDDVCITVQVKAAEGSRIIITDNGISTEKLWSKTETSYSLQTVLTELKTLPSTRTLPTTLKEAYPVGSKVIVLAQPNLGAVGEVTEEPTTGKEGIKLLVTTSTDPCINVTLLLNTCDDYFPAGAACRRISLSPTVFNRITGTCFLKCGDKRINIGLNLKYNKTNQQVPGYTKKENGYWLYSNNTINLVNSYWERFPEIFECLNKSNTIDISLEDVYKPELRAGKEEEIKKWIAEQPHASVAPVNCGSIALSTTAVGKLEAAIKHFKPQTSQNSLRVKPADLHKSDLTLGNIPPIVCTHELLDRVVSCRYSHTVPFGVKGYIISIYQTSENEVPTFDVLFDQTFHGGRTSLGASEPRVYVMSASSFANISAGQRLSKSTAHVTNIMRDDNLSLKPAWGKPMPSSVPSTVQNQIHSPAKNRPMQQQSVVSAFASVNQNYGNYPVKVLSSNELPAPPTETKFANMWRDLQQLHPLQPPKYQQPQMQPQQHLQQQHHQPAEALMKALNISTKSKPAHNPCTTLLSRFERSTIGVPKYNIEEQGNAFVAQVVLPNGQCFTGVPFLTRAEAAENAALQALAGMDSSSVFKTPQANFSSRPGFHGMPPNPMCQPGNRYFRPRGLNNNAQAAASTSTGPPMPPSNWRKEKREEPATPKQSQHVGLTNTSFVPLQAIRKANKFTSPRQKTKNVISQEPAAAQPEPPPAPAPNIVEPLPQKLPASASKIPKKKREMAALLQYAKPS